MTTVASYRHAGSEARRTAALRAVREHLANDPEPVRRVLCEISTHRAAGYEIEAAIATLDGAQAEVDKYRPRQLDQLAVYMPSNVLLYSYVLYLLVPSLYSSRVAFRPSSRVGSQTARLHEILAPVHGLPVDLTGVSQRAFLRDHVHSADAVIFTGAYHNAEQIRSQLFPGQLLLYFGGGVNPFVVHPGADLAHTARDAVTIRVHNSGQDCLGPDLFCVHEDLMAGFTAALLDELALLRYGSYDDPEADYGPLVYDGAMEEAIQFLARNRQRIVHGGRVDLGESRMEPTIVVGEEVTARTQVPEFFAPVFHVVPYRDPHRLAATLTTGQFTEKAMGSSVYGDAPELAAALSRRTTVTVNTSLLSIDDGNAPFGGHGRMANYVTDGHEMWAEPLLVSKAVAEHAPEAGAR
ncbi:aldehyde dehydrogenase family protein [Streptomyces iconiensis]|uniref:L-glutamate gamma-semialdehyde dehydrogenase n=1 Tax=Streptomyces iconiensis TaxID=1384038 RepID=A0ABT7A5D5_9ACTN|nr:aldehyde dehydrogenase family protein [Streptomyces iconiensis]MDJ1136547.1 aldehyde dehydrogenase family protein [Streptomyces iconiensis]